MKNTLVQFPVMCGKNRMPSVRPKLLDVVALLIDKAEEGLAVGQVGTVVEQLAPGVFEVEFCNAAGRTLGFAELRQEDLLVLRYEPAMAA